MSANRQELGSVEVFSKDGKSFAILSGGTAELESPLGGKTDKISLHSGEVLAAALSNNRQLFAAVLGGSMVNQLYVWSFDAQTVDWKSVQLAPAVGSPASLRWQEVDSPHPYSPLGLTLKTEDGKASTFPIDLCVSTDAPHRRSQATRHA